jgi:hypothetical protein
MRTRSLIQLGLIAALAAGLAACGGLSSGDSRVVVHLVDGPAVDYSAVKVDVRRVELYRADGSKEVLSQPNEIVDLMQFRNAGVAKTLADTTIPAGEYTELRLVLGPNNTVVDASGEHDLKVPSGMQSGIKMPLVFRVEPNTTKDLYIDFDAHKSVFVHETGSGKYMLRPVVRCYDKLETGAIVGTLSAASGPLVGVAVMAEEVDGTAVPSIARTAITDDRGGFVLDLLPVGHTFHVVSQPLVVVTQPSPGTTSYLAQAGGPFTIGATSAVHTWTPPAFAVATATGALGGSISPVAGEGDSDYVYALQPFTLGGASVPLVVRYATGDVSGTAPNLTETYAMPSLPVGDYTLAAERTTAGATRGPAAVPATVTSGATKTVNFNVPPPAAP